MRAAATTTSGTAVYARRVPEDSLLYGVVSDQLTTFLAHAERSGRSAPAFVERELNRYLECGILSYGFVRVRCSAVQLIDDCQFEVAHLARLYAAVRALRDIDGAREVGASVDVEPTVAELVPLEPSPAAQPESSEESQPPSIATSTKAATKTFADAAHEACSLRVCLSSGDPLRRDASRTADSDAYRDATLILFAPACFAAATLAVSVNTPSLSSALAESGSISFEKRKERNNLAVFVVRPPALSSSSSLVSASTTRPCGASSTSRS